MRNEEKWARLAQLQKGSEALGRMVEAEEHQFRSELFFRRQLPGWRDRVKHWRANMPNPGAHPIWYHLAEAYLRRLEVIICAVDTGKVDSLPDYTWAQLRTLAELMGIEVKRTRDDNMALLKELMEIGFPAVEAEKLIKIPRKRGPSKGPRAEMPREGKAPEITPLMTRKQVIEACEMRRMGKKFREIADHFCLANCVYRKDHDRKNGFHSVCANNVSKRVAQIEHALEKMPIR